MKLTRAQRLAWLRAVFFAAWHGSSHLSLWALLRSGKAVWRAVWSNHGQEVADEIYRARLAHCRDCVVYVEKLETCGEVVHNGQRMGCLCYMPALAQLKSGHCWLRDNLPFSDMGWPDELL